MAGGLIIREPSPCGCAVEHSVSPMMSSQEGALIVRPVSNNGQSDAQHLWSQQSSIITPMPISNELPTHNRHPWVTVESVTDEEAGLYRPNSPFGYPIGYDPALSLNSRILGFRTLLHSLLLRTCCGMKLSFILPGHNLHMVIHLISHNSPFQLSKSCMSTQVKLRPMHHPPISRIVPPSTSYLSLWTR